MVKPVDDDDKEFNFSSRRPKQTMNNLLFANDIADEISTPNLELNRAQVPFFVSHARVQRHKKVKKSEQMSLHVQIRLIFGCVDLATDLPIYFSSLFSHC